MTTNISFQYQSKPEDYVDVVVVDTKPKMTDSFDNDSININTTIWGSLMYVQYQDRVSVYASVTLWIWKIFPMFVLPFGTLGNVITIVVLLRRNMRNNSTSLYLLALAITDLVVLYFGLLRQYRRKVHDEDFRVKMGCGFHLWLVYTSIAYSSWILVGLTMDRLVSIRFPVYVRNRNSRRCIVIVLVVLFMVLALMYSQFIFSWESKTYRFASYMNITLVLTVCEATSPSVGYFHEHIWPWVDLSIVSLLPFVLLAVGNCSIGHNLLVRERSKRLNHLRKKDKNSSACQQRSATKLLIILSIVFFITTLPASVYLVVMSFYNDIDYETFEKLGLFWAIASACMYTNNAINFVLYCMSANNFRHELKELIKEMRQYISKTWKQLNICTCKENPTLKRLVDSLQHRDVLKQNKVGTTSAGMETGLHLSSVTDAFQQEQTEKGDKCFVATRTGHFDYKRSKCYTDVEMFTVSSLRKERTAPFVDGTSEESKEM